MSGKGRHNATFHGGLSCKTVNCFDSHQIWNKTPDSRVSKGERTHRGSKDPILQKKKKQIKQLATESSYRVAQTSYGVDWIIFIIGTSIGAVGIYFCVSENRP